ncbi:hypothetical protein BSR29_01445 [Boudabousia liubingyangii]|uniref:DUF4235 domain-containing protein n=1 Tax=Boudabousia liubingyangii TaxID=1921764 RepID=A0A1Q5PPW3_9ACTO|nr:DUF4235 domain-containing protein [Boudabousia liubingyangii]OKL48321.1 hypothetical protein BSR28_01035 [Boudabousia liubingyangii]OKL49648.1 hypothetical protein BSR29_01445 [Boudabousia liubingyangii]
MDIAWKVTNAITLGVAALAANVAVKKIWQAATGNTPPAPGDEEATARLGEVLAFGAISGLAMAAARRGAVRTANRWYGGKKFNYLEV